MINVSPKLAVNLSLRNIQKNINFFDQPAYGGKNRPRVLLLRTAARGQRELMATVVLN